MEIAITAAVAAGIAATLAWVVRGHGRQRAGSMPGRGPIPGGGAPHGTGAALLEQPKSAQAGAARPEREGRKVGEAPAPDSSAATRERHTDTAAGTLATPEGHRETPDGHAGSQRAADVAGDGRGPRADAELEARERRAELVRLEERILRREESLTLKLEELARREQALVDRERNAERLKAELREARQLHLRELERIAGLTQAQAKQILLREVEGEARHDSARLVRQIEEETRRDADRRVRSILSVTMQRLAAGHAAETTVSVVNLPADDMKGRIIGREGRNIRVLENLTGVDFIIDDTPSAVVLSAFDGVRREVARLTLEKLLQDGRIHPARIEEAYYQARSEIDNHIVEQGEQALFEANVHGLHPELVKLLGRLRYRTSYGQNVLAHSIEVSRLAAMMAEELGASPKTARRAALLHDIGKAVSHEIEGPHALVGGELARRYKEPEAVAHAMEAHHNEVEMQTVEAVIVQAADALSGARPGARGESLEQYVKRLKELEQIAERRDGVEKVYAMQAGREIRVMVAPGQVDDDEAALLSREIARDIEKELEYPGQIKVTVIRESRAVDYAK